jgi:hypothetical protein
MAERGVRIVFSGGVHDGREWTIPEVWFASGHLVAAEHDPSPIDYLSDTVDYLIDGYDSRPGIVTWRIYRRTDMVDWDGRHVFELT